MAEFDFEGFAEIERNMKSQRPDFVQINYSVADRGAAQRILPLAQDRWFGKAPEQKDEGVAYRALVKEVVDACARRFRPSAALTQASPVEADGVGAAVGGAAGAVAAGVGPPGFVFVKY